MAGDSGNLPENELAPRDDAAPASFRLIAEARSRLAGLTIPLKTGRARHLPGVRARLVAGAGIVPSALIIPFRFELVHAAA